MKVTFSSLSHLILPPCVMLLAVSEVSTNPTSTLYWGSQPSRGDCVLVKPSVLSRMNVAYTASRYKFL